MRHAIQTVRQSRGKWETIRFGFCEDLRDINGKPQRSTDFQGLDEFGWLFRCKENARHLSHLFHNRPASNVPKTAEEAKLWLRDEIAKQVVKPSRSLT
jgi:hypothetical protein